VRATIYGVLPSNPTHSARLMAEYTGIEHRIVWILPGLHPALIHLYGFRGSTVPAMKLDGRRYQHSRAISRALDKASEGPRLFPTDPARRSEVEEAERWGEEVLQMVPRRVYRWIAAHHNSFRTQLAGEVGIPLPAIAAKANAPVARVMASRAGATDERVRETLAELPGHLGHVGELISAGVIGGEEPNAADFQIVTSVRTLLCHEDLAAAIGDHPASRWARELMPEYPGTVPALIPPQWLEPLRATA
jgi:glutathione S-transferase